MHSDKFTKNKQTNKKRVSHFPLKGNCGARTLMSKGSNENQSKKNQM